MSESISIERLFRLGDYKSLRVLVSPSDLTDEQREIIMLDNIFDAYKTLYLHQLIDAQLNDRDDTRWVEMLSKLEDLKQTYMKEK